MSTIQTSESANLIANTSYSERNILPVNIREINKPFNRIQNALVFGSVGGIIIGLSQLLLLGGQGSSKVGISFWGSILIAPIIYFGLKKYKSHLAGGEVFKNGIIFGALISAIASSVMVLIADVGMAWQGGFIQSLITNHKQPYCFRYFPPDGWTCIRNDYHICSLARA